MAWTRSTRFRGSSRSVSRVPGPPPRTSTPPTAPSGGARTTVVPVSQPSSTRSVWPTRIPATSVIASCTRQPDHVHLLLDKGLAGEHYDPEREPRPEERRVGK